MQPFLRLISPKLHLITSSTRILAVGSASVLAVAYLARPFHTTGSSLSSSSRVAMKSEDFPKGKTESEWQMQLSPEQFRILRKKGTEMAGSGEYDKFTPTTAGTFDCVGCGTPLYEAKTKFASGCGWPAFYEALPGAVTQIDDSSWGMTRTEIVCTACNGHLGHVFKGEGYKTPTDERACVNSVSIKFNAADSKKFDENAAKSKA